jgi:hypothetical protein
MILKRRANATFKWRKKDSLAPRYRLPYRKTVPTLKEFPKGNPVNSHDVASSYIFFKFIYSVRILEVQQIGVVDFWDTWIRPMPPQCNGKPQSGNKKKKTTPLSLKNLTGAFLVLSVGLSLSFLAFLVEKVISIRERHLSHTNNKLQQESNNVIVMVPFKIKAEGEEPVDISE